ncbi:MAG: hypothetical protein KOO63_02585 [Bacteroidales bacterium]|nr:hypothetical protein [Candidatus Latescibacterota bacterium]
MKEIVKKIMETEKEIRGRIDEAKAKAQKVVRGAETKSREVVEQGRHQAVHDGQELIERLSREAERERALQVSKVSGGSEELLQKKSAGIAKAVTRIHGLVTGKEAE